MCAVTLSLQIDYPEGYPDEMPTFTLETENGTLEESEHAELLQSIHDLVRPDQFIRTPDIIYISQADQSKGEPLTFTIISSLSPSLTTILENRSKLRKKQAEEKERQAILAEENRLKGTPVTRESFEKWKAEFLSERARVKEKEEEGRVKGLGGKEREEVRKVGLRLTGVLILLSVLEMGTDATVGRQLFERDKDLDDADEIIEEGASSVDFSQYTATKEDREEEEESSRVLFEDSD